MSNFKFKVRCVILSSISIGRKAYFKIPMSKFKFKAFYFLVLGIYLDQRLDPFVVHGSGPKIDLV